MDTEPHWTRAQFAKRIAGAGAGLFLAGGVESAAARLLKTPRPTAGVRIFVSRPDLRPPVVKVVHRGKTADGLLFTAPSSGPGQRGALILDNGGDVVWFHPNLHNTVMNFRAAVYKGEPVLTWWEGKTDQGLGTGTHVIVDNSYRELARFTAGGKRPSDLHEFILTPHGTALVTSWESVPTDLSPYGGSANGRLIGGIVQELALPSGRVLFEWRSLDHVPPDESHQTPGVGGATFDYFHINSIDIDADGHFLVSARNTWAVYKLHRRTGQVLWRLGGKKSDFEMGKGTTFAWQHDARHHENLISLFDDGAAPKVASQSRALVIALDKKGMRATLQRAYTHRPAVLAHALGSMQLLPGGNVLVGWGTEPYFTEYAANGAVRFDAKLPRGGQNYRALRLPWTGHPSEAPKLVARSHAGTRRAYASWNGATEVASWQLRTGLSPSSLSDAATVPRNGFETVIDVPAGDRYAAVTALDRHGKPLRASTTTRIA